MNTTVRPARMSLRIAGSLFTGYRGADRQTTGVVATVSPWSSTFLRFGAEYTPFSPYGPTRLMWGIGYEDWRPSTFFLHVDDWGPIRPKSRYDIREAELDAGYRLPRLCATRGLCVEPVTALVAPFAGGPYLHARVNLAIGRTYFLMGGVGWTLPGSWDGPAGTPRWRIVYGLGRSDWSPGGLFVTYYDWGPDSRSGNGILAVGVNWAW